MGGTAVTHLQTLREKGSAEWNSLVSREHHLHPYYGQGNRTESVADYRGRLSLRKTVSCRIGMEGFFQMLFHHDLPVMAHQLVVTHFHGTLVSLCGYTVGLADGNVFQFPPLCGRQSRKILGEWRLFHVVRIV